MIGVDNMNQAIITIPMDESLKVQFDKFCEAAGTNIVAVVNKLAQNVVQENSFPFEVAENPVASKQKAAKKFIESLFDPSEFDNETLESFKRFDSGEFKLKFEERLP